MADEPARYADQPPVSPEQAAIALAALFPACPPRDHKGILRRYARQSRLHRGPIIGIIANIVSNWVRHRRTHYETMLYPRDEAAMSRSEARKAVADDVAAIVARWQQGGVEEDAAYKVVRTRLRQQRFEQGPSSDLTREQNDALVAAFERWLRDRGERVRVPNAPEPIPQEDGDPGSSSSPEEHGPGTPQDAP